MEGRASSKNQNARIIKRNSEMIPEKIIEKMPYALNFDLTIKEYKL